jgi:Protein of unknown function (DUF3110)
MPKTSSRLWILIYNSGTDNEGIYSRFQDGKNQVVAFETEDDALRYSIMLEAQDFPEPKVERIDEDELREFCAGANLTLAIVTSKDLAVPPEQNMERTDWQKDKKNPNRMPSQDSEQEESEFSADQLDSLRRRLEGLL